MKQFDEWWETRKKEKHDYSLPTSVDMLARQKDRRDAALASLAFRAGMLAAVEIIEEGIPINVSDRSSCDETLNYIAESIRKDLSNEQV